MSAPLYRSETRSSSITDLPYELRDALTRHADKRKLRLIDADVWLTHRTNGASKTMFGRLLGRRSNHADPDPAHDTVLVVHATHLLVATSRMRRITCTLSVPLLDAAITRAALGGSGPEDAPSDDGLVIGGFADDHGKPVTYFMGLGGAAAEACVDAARAAVDGAKLPPAET